MITDATRDKRSRQHITEEANSMTERDRREKRGKRMEWARMGGKRVDEEIGNGASQRSDQGRARTTLMRAIATHTNTA